MNVKLTKRKAWELISRIQPRLNIKQEATPPDVAIFKASTGPEGLGSDPWAGTGPQAG